MKNSQRILLSIVVTIFSGTAPEDIGLIEPAQAQYEQHNHDPNLDHFYKSRRQIEIIQTNPIVKYRDGTAGSGINSGLQNRETPLPPGGFQSYSPVPPANNSLTKDNKGALSKSGAHSLKAHTGSLGKNGKGKSHNSSSSSNKTAVNSYKPYAKYGEEKSTTPAVNSANGQNTSTKVKGNLLHWARGVHNGY